MKVGDDDTELALQDESIQDQNWLKNNFHELLNIII